MLNGATQVIGGVPGTHLDPILLAQSQEGDAVGFVLIVYHLQVKLYDLLFLQGSSIVECARMNPDLRFPIDIGMVKAMFMNHRSNCSVYLFRCTAPEVERFLATFHFEPCLKVHVNTISRKQIRALIKATGCRKGIVEHNMFQNDPPTIELMEIESTIQLPGFRTGLKVGRLLLYDLQKNEELRVPRLGFPQGLSPRLQFRQRRSNIRIVASSPKSGDDSPVTHGKPVDSEPPKLPTEKNNLDEFDELINRILSTPLSTENQVKSGTTSTRKSRKKSLRDTQPDELTPRPDETQQAAKDSSGPGKTDDDLDNRNDAGKANQNSATTDTTVSAEDENYVRLFQRLFRSFRQQAFECFGPRCESIAAQAEQQVRFLMPEFAMESLRVDTVPLMLDVIEGMINRAPFLKRSKLRSAAVTLVADLYNKHYDLLERYNAIDKVEQNYYQLKR